MNAPKRELPIFRGSITCAVALIVGMAGWSVQAKKTAAPSVDDQVVVECRLPPQMRSLGNNVTYLAAGRQVSTTIADCKVRGGTYDGHGPGALAAQATAPGAVPVTVGGDQSRAGCPKSGVVSGLKGGGTLSVRSAPGAASAKVDKLGVGKKVFMCDWSTDGDWVGVVYPGAMNVDCGVSKMIGRAQPYAGACRSGWVSSKYLKSKAG
jgi:hypothetical protein